jgi:hypothetical protein
MRVFCMQHGRLGPVWREAERFLRVQPSNPVGTPVGADRPLAEWRSGNKNERKEQEPRGLMNSVREQKSRSPSGSWGLVVV